jgi:hypothetical protein
VVFSRLWDKVIGIAIWVVLLSLASGVGLVIAWVKSFLT